MEHNINWQTQSLENIENSPRFYTVNENLNIMISVRILRLRNGLCFIYSRLDCVLELKPQRIMTAEKVDDDDNKNL